MAKLKTAYRPRSPELPAETPAHEIEQPAPAVVANSAPLPEPLPQAETKTDTPVLDQKPPEPQESEATKRLKQQLADLERSAELSRRQQQQADEINRQINEAFAFWKQNGLSGDQERLLAANPALMVQLSGFAATEAAKEHQVGSPEYVEAGKKLFFEHLGHLQEQMRLNQQSAEPPITDNHQTAEAAMPSIPPPPPGLLDQIPPRHEKSARSAIVSAPVSRELPGNYRLEFEDNPRNVRLSREQVEAAQIAGITPAEYARQLIRMKKAQANGEIQG